MTVKVEVEKVDLSEKIDLHYICLEDDVWEKYSAWLWQSAQAGYKIRSPYTTTLRNGKGKEWRFVLAPFPNPDCPHCKEVDTPHEVIEVWKEHIEKHLQNREEIVKEWNNQIRILRGKEFQERKEKFFYQFTGVDKPLTDLFKIGGTIPPIEKYIGKKCAHCGNLQLWCVKGRSDIEIIPQIKRGKGEECPKCGRAGSRYTDRRGYEYFQHYVKGKRKVCYIGKKSVVVSKNNSST